LAVISGRIQNSAEFRILQNSNFCRIQDSAEFRILQNSDQNSKLSLQLPMGIACSPNVCQAKISELVVALVFIGAYIDDLLFITKGSLDDHLSKSRLVLIRLRCVQPT
jgi:hypothetical protein